MLYNINVVTIAVTPVLEFGKRHVELRDTIPVVVGVEETTCLVG
jgi:hypothetical protein